MIPALLTCVFVAYLYRELHAEPPGAAAPESGSMTDRLDELRRRVTAITERLGGRRP